MPHGPSGFHTRSNDPPPARTVCVCAQRNWDRPNGRVVTWPARGPSAPTRRDACDARRRIPPRRRTGTPPASSRVQSARMSSRESLLTFGPLPRPPSRRRQGPDPPRGCMLLLKHGPCRDARVFQETSDGRGATRRRPGYPPVAWIHFFTARSRNSGTMPNRITAHPIRSALYGRPSRNRRPPATPSETRVYHRRSPLSWAR